MIQLEPGEYHAALNDVRIHYTMRGMGPVLIAHSCEFSVDSVLSEVRMIWLRKVS